MRTQSLVTFSSSPLGLTTPAILLQSYPFEPPSSLCNRPTSVSAPHRLSGRFWCRTMPIPRHCRRFTPHPYVAEGGPVRLIAEKKLNVAFRLAVNGPPYGHLGFLNPGYPSQKRELLVPQPNPNHCEGISPMFLNGQSRAFKFASFRA